MYNGTGRTFKNTVHELLEAYHQQGYEAYMDNYYNSVKRHEELKERKMVTCATIRHNSGILELSLYCSTLVG
jgi:hypothetical protein